MKFKRILKAVIFLLAASSSDSFGAMPACSLQKEFKGEKAIKQLDKAREPILMDLLGTVKGWRDMGPDGQVVRTSEPKLFLVSDASTSDNAKIEEAVKSVQKGETSVRLEVRPPRDDSESNKAHYLSIERLCWIGKAKAVARVLHMFPGNTGTEYWFELWQKGGKWNLKRHGTGLIVN